MILPHLDSRLNSLVIGNDYEFVPSLVTGDDREIILSSSGLQLGQLLTDDEANSKSDYNDYKFDEQDDNVDEHPNKKICNHRHTKQHIEEMEALFKECPKPDEKKMKELSGKVGFNGPL
ncbi:hypothetical protein KY289_030799 [Solanum tuberosum]|nr:hypothetical protein KY289_030799 [Solanum tuberosum]